MSAQTNKLVIRRYYDEVLRNGRSELIDELFAPEIRVTVHRLAFLDLDPITISDMVVEEDAVFVRWSSQFVKNGIAMYHLQDGVIVNLSVVEDNGSSRLIGVEEFVPAECEAVAM